MEVDSWSDSSSSSPHDLIVERLSLIGIRNGKPGLVAFAKSNNKLDIPDLLSAIMPSGGYELDEGAFRESMVWVQWLMFGGDPKEALENLSNTSDNQQGVCGSIFRYNDLAYQCRTCQQDPMCAICVPCFENGNHKDHDYFFMYTKGGVCDCGDSTAWKAQGFCSNHKGTGQIQPLPMHFADSLGHVLDLLLNYWKERLLYANSVYGGSNGILVYDALKVAEELTSAVVEMLLDFCKHESFLRFISERVYSSPDLLGILLRVQEQIIINEDVGRKLQELLLKMLSEPIFKYKFAKMLVSYYPIVISSAINEGIDAPLRRHPTLSTFSGQIFTVPSLAPLLVEDMDLMDVLLQCLGNVFIYCCGEDGKLQVSKWAMLHKTTLRVVEDIRIVLSHSSVPIYLCYHRRDLVRTLIRLVTSLQGMDTLKRQTESHTEDDIWSIPLPFMLCDTLCNILFLLVAGSFSVSSNDDSFPVNSCAVWLVHEGLRSIDKLLSPISDLSLKTSDSSGNIFLAVMRTLSRFRITRLFKSPSSSDSNPAILSEAHYKPFQGGLNIGVGSEGFRVLSSSDWPDIPCFQEISLHIPLHRLLSMSLRRSLKECFGESGSSYDPSADFFCQILDGCHPYGFSAFVMEHPLQIRVFCAQVHAGMWSGNEEIPILFIDCYRNSRWSEQGPELDIFMLQCCAALAPPDLYVQRILDRFELSNYLSMNLERSSEHEPILVAEMLALLIQIVKERRFCGLTITECLQRELVYWLSIGDATRSELSKFLSHDLAMVDEFQAVLDNVAEYSHPSGMNQGMYKLRSSFWRELDLYHPGWLLRNQQAAQERYFQFRNVSPLTAQLPRWTKIYSPLRGIAKIATCKTLLEIVRAVLFYAVSSNRPATSRAPDAVLQTALHLLALALDVCRSGDPLCYEDDVIPILAFAGEEIWLIEYGEQSLLSLLVLLMRMHEKEAAQNIMEAGNFNLSSLISSLIESLVKLEPVCMDKLRELEPQLANQFSYPRVNDSAKGMDLTSESEKRKAKSRERQAAILEKMRAQQSKFVDEMVDAESEEEDDDTQVICSQCRDPKSKSPVSFLVLLEKSRILSFVNQEPPSWEQVMRSGKEHVSSETSPNSNMSPSSISDDSEMIPLSQLEDLVLTVGNDFASTGQPHELDAFIEYIKPRFPSVTNIQLRCMSKNLMERTLNSLEEFEQHMYLSIRECQSSLNSSDSSRDEDICSAPNSESLFFGKYIASLPKEPLDIPSASRNVISSSYRLASVSTILRLESDDFGPSGADGVYVSSCGHAVHQECLDRSLSSLRDRGGVVFEGGPIVDPDQGEFRCPVCRGLANSVMPALPGDLRKVPQAPPVSNINFTEASGPSTSSDGGDALHLRDAFSLIQRSASIAGSRESLKAIPAGNVRLKPNLERIIHLLCRMYHPAQDKILGTGRVSNSLILWDTLKYSLISTEIAARSRKSSLNPNYSLGALYNELKNSSLVLSLLYVQSTKTMNSQTFLLRLRGLQLFAKSVCRGAYSTELFGYSKGGNMLHILENSASELLYPDIQFWRQASEPILARDPFLSLMWILFCLPFPLLSCKESFFSLVHVFYLVAVIQAIFAYCKERQSTETDLGMCDSLFTDIRRVMSECREAVQYFEAHSVNSTYDINNSVRSLALPYLRRCALLWKLINCSNMPFSDESEDTCNIAEELPAFGKLENMFEIPPLDLIVRDKESRRTALDWMDHFSQVCEVQRPRHVLRCSPAVPFRLMHLPRLYQDLLQRYTKKPCPDCGIIKEEPALCLLCGKSCSPNWEQCCSESGCETHALACGAGIGVFLFIRRTAILLQRSARQAPWPSPYLDAFGEEDFNVLRGRPLFLSEERYAALTHMVASHSLDPSSKVLELTTVDSLF